MKKLCLALILLIGFSSTTYAQQSTADTLSYITLIGNLTLNTVQILRSDEKLDNTKVMALRVGIAVGASELLKRLVHEERPDHSDKKSFPSEHSAISCASVNVRDGKQFSIDFSLALSTMTGRVVAEKHNWWDVLAGCGIGLATGFIGSPSVN